jgi:hypothetical protein
MAVAISIAAILVIIVVVTLWPMAGQGTGNVCLYVGTDSQTGTSGELAVPQSGATQAACDNLAVSVQQAFANSQTGVNSFAISSDLPVTLSSAKLATLQAFGSGTNWLIYSGNV